MDDNSSSNYTDHNPQQTNPGGFSFHRLGSTGSTGFGGGGGSGGNSPAMLGRADSFGDGGGSGGDGFGRTFSSASTFSDGSSAGFSTGGLATPKVHRSLCVWR